MCFIVCNTTMELERVILTTLYLIGIKNICMFRFQNRMFRYLLASSQRLVF
jgi:hypothetical protein